MSLRVIKKGDRSNLVGEWQSFLRGEKLYLGQIDNHFGNLTETATIKFQEKNRLKADGIVGKNTYDKAIQKGFHSSEILVSAATNTVVTNNANVPPIPNFSPITGNANRERLFGKIEFVARPTKTNPEGIRITNDFESKNIIRVELPALSKATNGAFTAMRWHKECEYQLVKMFERFEKEKLHTHILSYAGAFYPRFIRGSRTQLSNHSWGTAFDINVAQNGLGKVPAMIGQTGSVRELVPIANECGFYWGGHFGREVNGKMVGRLDGMHFEIAKIINSNL
jgi:hypothetical protein